jgi:mRNA interferase MazF
MQNYVPGELIFVTFPFGSAQGAKRRPALVLLDIGDDDIVVARVTSQAKRSAYDVELQDWQQAGLLLPSIARLNKLATLEKRMVERRLGRLTARDWTQVRNIVRQLWSSI